MSSRHSVKVVDPGLPPGQLEALQRSLAELEAVPRVIIPFDQVDQAQRDVREAESELSLREATLALARLDLIDVVTADPRLRQQEEAAAAARTALESATVRLDTLRALELEMKRYQQARQLIPQVRELLTEARNPPSEIVDVPMTGWYRLDERAVASMARMTRPPKGVEAYVGPVSERWFFLCIHGPGRDATRLLLLNNEAEEWFGELSLEVARDALAWARASVRAHGERPPAEQLH